MLVILKNESSYFIMNTDEAKKNVDYFAMYEDAVKKTVGMMIRKSRQSRVIDIHQCIYELLEKLFEHYKDVFRKLGTVDHALNLAFQTFVDIDPTPMHFFGYGKLLYYMMLPIINNKFSLQLRGPESSIEIIPFTLEKLNQKYEDRTQRALKRAVELGWCTDKKKILKKGD